MGIHWVIVLTIVASLLWYFSRKGSSSSNEQAKPPIPNRQVQPVVQKAAHNDTGCLPPIPKGFKIFETHLSVAGIQFRKEAARQFVRGSLQTVELERESNNTEDPNAIKIIGVSRGTRYFIGYVPKETAEQIVGSGLGEVVKPRLKRLYEGNNGFVDVVFQIIGPKESKKQYDDFLKSRPADLSQKEFYKFFGLPIPKGLTVGQAAQTIAEYRQKQDNENTAKLDEWEAYEEIRDEFDDADFRASFDLKKVSLTLLNSALSELQQEGVTLRTIADDIDKVVAKIIALKPDIEKKQ